MADAGTKQVKNETEKVDMRFAGNGNGTGDGRLWRKGYGGACLKGLDAENGAVLKNPEGKRGGGSICGREGEADFFKSGYGCREKGVLG